MTPSMSLKGFLLSMLLMTVAMVAAIPAALWLIEPLTRPAAIRGGIIAWTVMFGMRLTQWILSRKKVAGPA